MISRISKLTLLVYGPLFVVSVAWSKYRGLPWIEEFAISWRGVFLGLLGAGLLALVNFSVLHFLRDVPFFRGIARVCDAWVYPFLRGMTGLDIVIVSVCAGVVEEALFRGVLQEELGIVWASLLFGLAHAIALELVVWITGIGFLLGWFFAQTGDIATVMICHGVYDALVIYYMRRHYRPPRL